MSRLPTFSLLAAAMLSLAACTAPTQLTRGGPDVPAAVATSEAVPADDNLNAVLWVQRAQEYRALTTQTWRMAAATLDRALADPQWTALLPGEGAELQQPGLKPAVVVDVDETMLDNSPYQARLVLDGKSYKEESWAEWVAEKRARPVPGALEFARAANARGVTLIYISNRTDQMKADTLDNLRAAGFPVADDGVYLGMGVDVPGCTRPADDKGCRRIKVASQYRVLMQVGDQITDFGQPRSNDNADRDALLAGHPGWLGERWFMLPNPTYGGYESAAVGNRHGLSAAQRRAAKHAALEPAR
ncbi:5'-nucleotidase, lipoprotein e(P4) family [Stenotrophomonas daejeonensis]|nr:5'-nucleotidase, lipoprotein e(P4) family [Stenotrophomonas daejeonensis]